MADLNLDTCSLAELKQLQKDVARAIATFEERQKAEARLKLDSLAREMGYSLTELAGAEAKGKRPRSAPKYRHPQNPALTWTGRGRKPGWFTDALKAGRKPEDLEIG
jgi:DNA-binding protein H-NS